MSPSSEGVLVAALRDGAAPVRVVGSGRSRTFQQVCIETEQEPDVIQALWERYQAGFDYGKKRREETEEGHRQRERDGEMREMDRELERRRRGVPFDDARNAEERAPGLARANRRPDDQDSITGGHRG